MSVTSASGSPLPTQRSLPPLPTQRALPPTAARVAGPLPAISAWSRLSKRALDLVVSLLLLAVIAIPMLVIALLVRLTSRGPAIFRQIRLGQDEKPFTIYKFRTMRQDSPEDIHREYVLRQLASADHDPDGATIFKLSSDPRVTPLGRILRRTSLDELPQLFNVVLGQMSLVGPRPSLPWEAELFPPDCRGRFLVPPGITGLWQTSGRSRLTMAQALRLDVEYVTRWTLRQDLLILMRTIPAVLRCSDAR
jgi:lipopolysaccharide/colanic/teichoic acid biosynthesis glycosyltransferase